MSFDTDTIFIDDASSPSAHSNLLICPPVNLDPQPGDPPPSPPLASALNTMASLFERLEWTGIIAIPLLALASCTLYRVLDAELSVHERRHRRAFPEADTAAEAARRASFQESPWTDHQNLQFPLALQNGKIVVRDAPIQFVRQRLAFPSL
ncbi:hypothetical protein N7481_000375 [Penicillium waksmanii]|uniref:uncharacterized protein n=1 Tax=Penicillium waksmanii TaxID=69791 RepID=UPI002547B600|nr:uncharacterized protein N7481_000375 [Penicillium waksmanii]KAJ5999966.1 hypothetical protein N7481_000375 [Penicillium waksmanii]